MTRMADEATSVGAGGDETVVVAPVTVAAPELAWSADDAAEEWPGYSWRMAWGNAAVFILVGMVLAGVIGVVGWVSLRGEPEPLVATQTATATTVVTVAAPAPASPTPIKELTPDEQYILGLQRAGIDIHNKQNAIITGHSVCRMRGNGMSYSDIAVGIITNNPTFTQAMADASVVAAVGAYCPTLAGTH